MARRNKSSAAAAGAPTRIPTLEAVSIEGSAPIVESEPVRETDSSVLEAAPILEPRPNLEDEPRVEAAPVLDDTLRVEEAVPVIDEPAPEVDSALVSASPLTKDTPAMEETPILESAPEGQPTPEAVAAIPETPEAPMASLMEAQGKMRTMVETGLNETHSKYSQMKSVADEAAQAIEASYATVKNGAVQFNVKALEALSATATANFDFFKSVFAVKSPSEYVILHSEFARKHIEMMTAQTKAFGELAQKVAADTVEPIKARVAKTFNMH